MARLIFHTFSLALGNIILLPGRWVVWLRSCDHTPLYSGKHTHENHTHNAWVCRIEWPKQVQLILKVGEFMKIRKTIIIITVIAAISGMFHRRLVYYRHKYLAIVLIVRGINSTERARVLFIIHLLCPVCAGGGYFCLVVLSLFKICLSCGTTTAFAIISLK